jgi:hypothetical protein
MSNEFKLSHGSRERKRGAINHADRDRDRTAGERGRAFRAGKQNETIEKTNSNGFGPAPFR